jgi:hypothetical protein
VVRSAVSVVGKWVANDACRDLVGQAVPGQGGGQAQGGLGCPGGDLDQVDVCGLGGGAVAQAVQAVADLFDDALVAKLVEVFVSRWSPAWASSRRVQSAATGRVVR